MDNATRAVEDRPGESWRPVPGWEGLYEVSDQGRVYSHRSRKVLRTLRETSGHLRLDLCRDYVRRPVRVHVLVLEAFAGPRPDGFEACHRNNDPADNRLENLRWDSKSRNTIDRVLAGDHPQTRKTHCPRGHRLADPNLDAFTARQGRRRCRACAMEQAAARYRGEEPDYAKADFRYRLIMAGLRPVKPRRVTR